MKVLKIIGLIILVLIGIFVIMGLIKPGFSITNSIEIDRPVNETFAIFHKEELLKEWITGYKKMEFISGNPNEVGGKQILYFEQDGQAFNMTETITDWKENELFGFDVESDFWNGHNAVTFTPNGENKTTVTYTMDGCGNGMFMGALMPFFKGALVDANDLQYKKLKAVAENYTFPEPEPMMVQDSVMVP